MARYVTSNCHACRRAGEKLFLKSGRCYTPKCAIEKRASAPGQHGAKRRKLSERGLQLKEKQKARYIYGLMERQFKKVFHTAEKQVGHTGLNLLMLLERRLDNVIFRLGYGNSRDQARQLVRHGFFLVNNKKVNIPSYWIKPGDVIAWRPHSLKTKFFQSISEGIGAQPVPGWISLDKENNTAKIVSLPDPQDISPIFSEKSIVEYYSR